MKTAGLLATAGLVALLGAISLLCYMGYVQWFVHPEYTQPQMFWAYWREFVSMAALYVVAVYCFERSRVFR
jgi:hypothetical protein